MAQVVEHILGKDEVTGSSPVSSSKRQVFTCLFVLSFFVYCNYVNNSLENGGNIVYNMFEKQIKE